MPRLDRNAQIETYVLTKPFWSKHGGFYDKTDNLRAWWPIDTNVSAAGNVTDSSGAGRDGTFDASSNRPAFDDGDTPSTYIQSATSTWDASTDAIKIGTHTLWNSIIGATKKCSVSMWAKKEGDGDDRHDQEQVVRVRRPRVSAVVPEAPRHLARPRARRLAEERV